MSFELEGFLSAGWTEGYRRHLTTKYADLFEVSRRLNLLAHEWKYKSDVKSRDPQAIVTYCLFQRVLNSYASVTRLTEIGLVHDALAVLRVELEAVFHMRDCALSEEQALAYIKSDQVERRKILNVAKDKRSSLHELFKADSEALDKLLGELNEQVENEDIRELKARDAAERAGLLGMYDLVYRFLCSAVHTSVRFLEDFVDYGGSEEPKEFTLGITDEPIPRILVTNISTMITALDSLAILFGQDKTLLAPFRDDMKRFDTKYSGITAGRSEGVY